MHLPKTLLISLLSAAIALPTVEAVTRACVVDIEVEAGTGKWGGPITIRAKASGDGWWPYEARKSASKNLSECINYTFQQATDSKFSASCNLPARCSRVEILDRYNNDAVFRDGDGNKLSFNDVVTRRYWSGYRNINNYADFRHLYPTPQPMIKFKETSSPWSPSGGSGCGWGREINDEGGNIHHEGGGEWGEFVCPHGLQGDCSEHTEKYLSWCKEPEPGSKCDGRHVLHSSMLTHQQCLEQCWETPNCDSYSHSDNDECLVCHALPYSDWRVTVDDPSFTFYKM